jgi:hypothetical protein
MFISFKDIKVEARLAGEPLQSRLRGRSGAAAKLISPRCRDHPRTAPRRTPGDPTPAGGEAKARLSQVRSGANPGGRRRALALGINQISALAGEFIGLVAGGLLASLDWRAVFWVNVIPGVVGTVWAYRKLRDIGTRHRGRIDWWGNITFAVGLGAILTAITHGIQPYRGHTVAWTNPAVFGSIVGGVLLLVAFAVIESRARDPMFELSLFRIRAFTAGSAAGLCAAIARGGLQFMLIIWLRAIWLPLHGYDYSDTPLWAGI